MCTKDEKRHRNCFIGITRDITESYKHSFEHHQYISFLSSCVIYFYSASFGHDLVYKSHFRSLSKNYSVLFLNYSDILLSKTLSRLSLLTHDRKESSAYNENEQYKSVVFNRALLYL